MKTAFLSAHVLLCTALCAAQNQSVVPQYDVVIRNGRVLDGAGNPWIKADVAINNGRFVRIGMVDGKGRREVDAAGLYVSPGWIDMLDQSGEILPKNGLAENKLREGITTLIYGEGGPPVTVEGLPRYLTDLQAEGISPNFGTYFSESQAREAVIGLDPREPTPAELEAMKAIMARAMQEGALGMTTALTYAPSSYATTHELIEMAKVARSYGGLYASHVRGEGSDVVQAIDELIEIADQAKIPAEIFHIKVAYQPGWNKIMPQLGEHIAAARARGIDVADDMYVYDAAGTGLESTIPIWAHEGGREKLQERLKDPEIRARLKQQQKMGYPGWWNMVESSGGWDGIVLVDALNEANRKYEGKSIAEIGHEMGKDPADAAFDLVMEANEGDRRVLAVYHMMTEQDIDTAIRFPWTSFGSDGGSNLVPGGPAELAHPRAYNNFPRIIAHYVRERHILTLEDAIRKMTSLPAERTHLQLRGLIRVGDWADVTIFDYDEIQDHATYEHPAMYADGIPYVLVNGVVVVDHGKHTGAKPGQVLYGPGYIGSR